MGVDDQDGGGVPALGSDHRDAVFTWRRLLTLIAQVVPDLPTFAVDDGFAYRVPEDLEGIEVGSIVRVPLGGRRLRGHVVGVRRDGAPVGKTLKDIISRSGDLPVFNQRLLETLRWAAIHYVAPIATLLGRSSPPNLPRRIRVPEPPAVPEAPDAGLGPKVLQRLSDHRHVRPQYVVGPGPWEPAIAAAASITLGTGRNAAVVCPTVEEASALYEHLAPSFGSRLLRAWSALPAKEATRTWVAAATSPGHVIVGTREIVLWPLGELGLMVVMDEGRRAMKAPQTPTLHVRELVRRRSAIERFGVMFTGTVPTAEVLGTGVEIDDLPGRAWPLVEVADRAEEPPGAGVVLERTRRAVTAMVKAGERVFVFVSRRGYAPAFRCINCGEMRQCAACESGPGRGDTCDRCGAGVGPCRECSGRRFAPLGAAVGRVVDDLARSVGDHVGEAGQGRLVTVGTERDLPAIEPGALAVVIDADSMILAPNYRATEDALRIMSRVATKVRRGSGHRCVVQTAMAHHPVITALRHGGPESFMAEVLEQRMSAGFPPSGEVLAIEIAPGATRVDTELRAAAGDATVLGPADQGGRSRWLVQGRDLRPLRIRLRSLVQDWRDAGLRVRVDADPIDL